MLKNTIGSGFKERFLISPYAKGLLDGLTFSVKDVFNIQNRQTSFGNPLWEQTHPLAAENAICVQQLLMNGASCLGSTITGELGCGSSGTNHFFGTPLNPKAPDLVPGGSSCGSASTVAEKLVDFSLGTDSGGSIRVPASFCGIFGMRPSQGIISNSGVIGLAPSLDTVGVLSNSIEILAKVMSILLSLERSEEQELGNIYVFDDLRKICSREINDTMDAFSENYCKIFKRNVIKITLNDLDNNAIHGDLGIANTFLHILCGEIWTSISSWAKEVGLEYGKNTYVDFSFMQNLDKEKITKAVGRMEFYFKKINDFLSSNNIVCIPTTPFTAIARRENKTTVNEFDYNKLRPLVSLASIGRLPQISVPINKSKPPIGLSFIAGFRRDDFLLKIVEKLYNKVLINL